MSNNTSQHILSTAANLMGLCLIVITSFHFTDRSKGSIIDEIISVVALLLIVCCLFSFTSIRISNIQREKRFEVIADYLFYASLIGIFIIILLISFNFIK